MAGLSVLLETKESGFPRYSHVLSKTSLLKNASSSASAHGGSFLEHCCLCRRKLEQGKDIYMYRGDRAFCSEECRCRQIFTDEESGMRDNCSLAAAAAAASAASAASAGRRLERMAARRRALAGGFAC